jgi:hypothetical protein
MTVPAAVINLPAVAPVYLVACFIVPERGVAEEGTAGAAEVLRKHPTGASKLVKLAIGVPPVLLGAVVLVRSLREVLIELVDLLSRLGGLTPGVAILGLALVVAGAVPVALSTREGLATLSSSSPRS